MYNQSIRDSIESQVGFFTIQNQSDIDNMLNTLQDLIRKSMDQFIPITKSCPYKRPYWDNDLTEQHNNQKALRRVWISEGRPRGKHFHSFSMYKAAK